MAANEPPTEDELPQLVEDLAYEVRQFGFSAQRSNEITDQLFRLSMERNAHVESMLIHARCLVDFFLNEPRKDDVVASHYVPDWSPEKDGGEALAWLEASLGTFIDKRVAHLTAYRRRVPITDEAHFTNDVIAKMSEVVATFRRRLDPSLRERLFGPDA